MRIELNFKSGKPTYLQIVDQVKYAAASGALRPGEPLPGIRPLAEQLRVNRNTVAKAYTELEHQGVVENIMGKGCFLAQNHSPLKQSVRRQWVIEVVDAAIVQAHHLQVKPEELKRLLEERLEAFDKRTRVSERNP